jgi:hypothetical protein
LNRVLDSCGWNLLPSKPSPKGFDMLAHVLHCGFVLRNHCSQSGNLNSIITRNHVTLTIPAAENCSNLKFI